MYIQINLVSFVINCNRKARGFNNIVDFWKIEFLDEHTMCNQYCNMIYFIEYLKSRNMIIKGEF